MANRFGLTDAQVAHWLNICEAHAQNRPIQFRRPCDDGKWLDYTSTQDPSLISVSDGIEWRIKPEPVTVEAWAVVNEIGCCCAVFLDERSANIHAHKVGGMRLVKTIGEFIPC